MGKHGWMVAVVGCLAVATGCAVQPDFTTTGGTGASQPPSFGSDGGGSTSSGPACGDGVCDLGESAQTCPEDCAPSSAPVCDDTQLGDALPLAVRGTTVGGSAAPLAASCGDGAATPAASYLWSAPAAGVYRVAVSASYPVVVSVRGGSCGGDELACDAAELTNVVHLDVPLPLGAAIDVAIGGEGGATGTFALTIDREPDACGDSVCEVGETADSCAVDCAAPTGPTSDPDPDPTDPTGPTCGDGVCDAGEDATCPIDCGSSTTTPPDDGGSPSFCGDGTCDGGEDSDSCPSDCGDPTPAPSCDPTDPDCF